MRDIHGNAYTSPNATASGLQAEHQSKEKQVPDGTLKTYSSDWTFPVHTSLILDLGVVHLY